MEMKAVEPPGALASTAERIPAHERHGVSFREAFWVWVRVAALSFGGPAGQIAVMHRILVEEKRWISETRFLHALNYCTLVPGPEAHKLAVYVGWLLHRTRGGLVAGILFILPGLAALGILSWVYASYGNVGIVQALFFGLKAAVLAVVLEAVVRVGRRALKSQAMVAVAALSFIGIFFFAVPFPLIIASAALVGIVGNLAGISALRTTSAHDKAIQGEEPLAAIDVAFAQEIPEHVRPSHRRALKVTAIGLVLWLGPLVAFLAMVGPDNVFTHIAVFFSKLSVVTFGGAYAILAYVAQQAVEHFHWLAPGEMLAGLGMAETTPGPLISVVQFVGFMAAFRHPGSLDPVLAGTLGGLLAKWVTFAPSFLFIFIGAPYVEALRGNKALNSALSAITAAVVGVILNLAVWFALHTLFGQVNVVRAFGMVLQVPELASVNRWALVLSLAAMLALFRFKAGMMATLAGCCAAGMIIHSVGLIQ
ncbi:putative chromate transport protein [Paraburkholderia ultramafica]|uniref:Putative chromate transport protein n=1 Tax=Paraburkholderia ultramafica TaxID=1544867 RepID=A0A6S7B6W4_9BURK|nr:chromate efflux transporter [Paraburkholderia ultramafica]CAB3789744.1 putative chromate transport protein [Paraburkholderia ultramafica]